MPLFNVSKPFAVVVGGVGDDELNDHLVYNPIVDDRVVRFYSMFRDQYISMLLFLKFS